MTLIRWSPRRAARHEVASIQDEVNRLFESALSPRARAAAHAGSFVPAADIQETAEAFVIHLDLPGVPQSDVKVSLLGDTLTIRGERKRETSQETSMHRSERVTGRFERSFSLGASVRADQVQASYRDGVLEVRVPKAEAAREREIQVQIG